MMDKKQSSTKEQSVNLFRGVLSPTQTEVLLRPIKPQRIYSRDGHSNLAAWDVAAHLTRMFGFGCWEKEILSLDLVSERRGNELGLSKDGWYVTYRCVLRLRVFRDGHLVWENDDVATGTAQNQPSHGDAHDHAAKNAVSSALKRCAKDLGDQFGLSLYNNSLDPVVIAVVGHTGEDATEPDVKGETS